MTVERDFSIAIFFGWPIWTLVGNFLHDGNYIETSYSCGYWKNSESLDQAQETKLELCCRKLGLKPGMRVLDIGCGWGSFAKYAAEKYQVEVVGITVSKEQIDLGQKLCAGLPIDLRFLDYRNLLDEKFDRILSLGMIEHVGHRNYNKYMRVVHQCLEDDGLFLLQTIGRNEPIPQHELEWITRYIFPNSEIPSMEQLSAALSGQFVVEDWENFGSYYDKTLLAWHDNFVSNWDSLRDEYDERFFRMWNFYLLGSAGFFRSRYGQVWQILLSKKGIPGGFVREVAHS